MFEKENLCRQHEKNGGRSLPVETFADSFRGAETSVGALGDIFEGSYRVRSKVEEDDYPGIIRPG